MTKKLDKVYTTFETEEKHLKEMTRMDKELVRVREYQNAMSGEAKTGLQIQKYTNSKVSNQQESIECRVKLLEE